MNATRVPLSTWTMLLAMFLAANCAHADELDKLRPDFLWFVSGHGVNVSQVADGGESPLATAKFVSVEKVPPAAAARARIGEIRGAVARLQTPGEHVLPAGYGPGGANADLMAAGLLAKLGGNLDAGEIDLVVGIDLKTGAERTLVRATREGSLLNPETADAVAAGFVPLYSVGQDRVRIHFKSDTQYRPAIDRSALAPFGSQKGDRLEPHGGAASMPVAVLARAASAP